MARSMTGFARQEATHSWGTLQWEIRSVNHRYLEPHFRLPDSLRAIESDLRSQLKRELQRGKVEMSLQLQLTQQGNSGFDIDHDLVNQINVTLEEIDHIIVNSDSVNLMEVMQWPGVIKSQSVDMDALQKAALELFDKAIKQVCEHRSREGQELQQFIEQRLSLLSDEVVKIRKHVPAIMQAQQDKIRDRLQAIKAEINQDRLEQELVFYAQKADVDEELDRLDTHVTEAHHILKQKGAIGRRLDFLMQELNREANTLSSKSIATLTTQSAMELKIIIEQMREQIQNIE